MWSFIKSLLGSKKFVATVLAVIAYFTAKVGFEFDPNEAAMAISPFLAFILGQGLADLGKEKSKVESATVKELKASDPS